MKRSQIKIPENCISIKTPVQATFHLDRGATLALPVTKKTSIFIKKNQEKVDVYDLALVPLIGKSKLYTGNFESVCKLLNEYEFMVLKKSNLVERKPNILDHISNFFSRLKG